MMLEWSGEGRRVTVEAGGGPSIDTDQKVGGSNPSGRAPQIRCTAAASVVSGDLGTRSHPINRPIESGPRPLVTPVGVSIVVRTVALMRDARGSGSLRQRRPGVWEVRVAVGPDPVSGRPRYRSLTVHGNRQSAQATRQRWAAKAELLRGLSPHPSPATQVPSGLRCRRPAGTISPRQRDGFSCGDCAYPTAQRKPVGMSWFTQCE